MKLKPLSLVVALACSSTGFAIAAPTSGAYVTDPQNEWVQEKLSNVISTPNLIMCFMGALRADEMVNQGNYLALIDMDKCNSSKRGEDNSSSTNAGASAATNYTRVLVNSTRASNSDPMLVKVWFLMSQGIGDVNMFAYASVSESPSTSNPNGLFSMSFCGVPAAQADPLTGTCSATQGALSASGATLSFSEAGNQGGGYSTQLTLTRATDGSSGSGRVRTTENGGSDGAFAFNSTNFKRGSSEPGACFSRDRNNASFSTWRYGVYNGDGSRLELAHPSFPITATYNGQTYWGGAGFWGIFLPTTVLDNVTSVQRMTPGSNATTTYDLTKAGGKLYKMSKQAGTLDSLKGQPIMVYIPANVVSGDNTGGQYELAWNGTALQANRKQTYSNGTWSWTDLSSAALTVTAANLRSNAAWMQSLQGWSQSAGGEIRIDVPASGEFATSTAIATRTREVVVPGSVGAPTNLGCVNRCPKGGLQASDFSSGSPFQNISVNNWGQAGTTSTSSELAFQPVALANVIQYTFSSTGLLTTAGSQPVDASSLTLTGNNQWGLQSGRLLDTSNPANYAALRCASGSGYAQSDNGDSICPWLVENAAVFYTYETGPNAWNRYIGLSTGGQAVTFDAPRIFALTSSTVNTTLASGNALIGSTVQLQFNGFGDLQGIPGKCVNMNTNLEIACGSDNTVPIRWVPAFSIKDGTELTSNGSSYYAKYLEREMRFAKVDDSNCTSLSLPVSATLPGAPSADPRTTNGAKPTVTDAPKVIHGVVQ